MINSSSDEIDLSSDDRTTLDPDYRPSSFESESTMAGTLNKKIESTDNYSLKTFYIESNFDLSFDDTDAYHENDPFGDPDDIFHNIVLGGSRENTVSLVQVDTGGGAGPDQVGNREDFIGAEVQSGEEQGGGGHGEDMLGAEVQTGEEQGGGGRGEDILGTRVLSGEQQGRGGRATSGQVRGRGGAVACRQRSRHPTAIQATADLDLIDPVKYLELNRNGNTKRNCDVAMKTYNRVMSDLSRRSGETFEPLKEASVERLPYLLMKFLQSAKRADGSVYASGTINTNFNGICNILAAKEDQPVSVKVDPRFKKVLEMLKIKTGLSAAEGRGAGCDAKRPVTSEHLRLAVAAGSIGRGGPKSLVTSVYLGAVLGWGCRAGAECHMIQNKDLIAGPVDRKTGVPEWIELSERVTKTRTGNPGDERELIPRIFPDDEFPDSCYVRTLFEYQRRKSPAQQAPHVPFFLNVLPAAAKHPQQHQFWYVGTGEASSGIMGIHTIESLITDALEAAGVNCKIQKYSAISLRKSMLQSGVDCNVPDLHLSRLAGHKALVSKKAYVNSAGLHHKTTGRVIHRQLFHNVNRGYDHEMRAADASGGRSSEQQITVARSQSSSPSGGSGWSPRARREQQKCTPGDRKERGRRERYSNEEERDWSNCRERMSTRNERRSQGRKSRSKSIRDRSRSKTSRDRSKSKARRDNRSSYRDSRAWGSLGYRDVISRSSSRERRGTRKSFPGRSEESRKRGDRYGSRSPRRERRSADYRSGYWTREEDMLFQDHNRYRRSSPGDRRKRRDGSFGSRREIRRSPRDRRSSSGDKRRSSPGNRKRERCSSGYRRRSTSGYRRRRSSSGNRRSSSRPGCRGRERSSSADERRRMVPDVHRRETLSRDRRQSSTGRSSITR